MFFCYFVINTDSMNDSADDYYAILGIDHNASYPEIKKAYRKQVKKYHPDRKTTYKHYRSSAKPSKVFDNDETMIKKINAAFEILSDHEKRKKYEDDRRTSPYFDKSSGNGYQNDYRRTTNESKGSSPSYYHSSSYSFYEGHNKSNASTSGLKEKGRKPYNNSSEKDSIAIPKSRFQVTVDSSLCMAFGSCETLAPKVFVVDKDKSINPKAVVKSETGADFDTILSAAQTCPTKAIFIVDRYTGEQIYP
jgi:curved DNA-binding protein CbpA